MNIEELLLSILECIEYADDKKKYAQSLMTSAAHEAIADLLESLPAEKQQNLLNQTVQILGLDTNQADDALELLSKQTLDQEDLIRLQTIYAEYGFMETFQKRMLSLLNDFLQTIEPTLSDDQLTRLNNYLSQFAGNK